MARPIKDIVWLSGLLEGEGCFFITKKPDRKYKQHSLRLSMSDKDVVQRAATILGTEVFPHHQTKTGKMMYRTAAYGPQAIGWMMTLYVLLGKRRQHKIREIINIWQQTPASKASGTKYNKRYMKVVG